MINTLTAHFHQEILLSWAKMWDMNICLFKCHIYMQQEFDSMWSDSHELHDAQRKNQSQMDGALMSRCWWGWHAVLFILHELNSTLKSCYDWWLLANVIHQHIYIHITYESEMNFFSKQVIYVTLSSSIWRCLLLSDCSMCNPDSNIRSTILHQKRVR